MRRAASFVAVALVLGSAAGSLHAQDTDPDTVPKKAGDEAVKQIREHAKPDIYQVLDEIEKAHRKEMADRVRTGRRGEWACDREGRRVAAVNGHGQVEIWTDADPAPDVVIDGLPEVSRVVFDATRPLVYVACRDRAVRAYSTEDGSPSGAWGGEPRESGTPGAVSGLGTGSWVEPSPDGRHLVVLGGLDDRDCIYDADRFVSRGLHLGEGLDEPALARYLADSRRLLVRSWTGLALYDLDGAAADEAPARLLWRLRHAPAGNTSPDEAPAPLGEGWLSFVRCEPPGTVVTLQVPYSEDDGMPCLTGWAMADGAQRFRVAMPLEDSDFLEAPDADVVFLVRPTAPDEPVEIDVRSGATGKRVRVLTYPVEGPRPRLLAPDGRTAFDTDPDGRLIRIPVPPPPNVRSPK